MRLLHLSDGKPVSSKKNPLVPKYVARRVVCFLLVLLAGFLFNGALPTASGTFHQASRLDQNDSVCISFSAGWNLVSLPVKGFDGRTIVQFPTAVSAAFCYCGGYMRDDTLRWGMGYWLKFDSAQTICLYDTVVTTDTINVVAGWNLIGSISFPVSVNSIVEVPPAITLPQFFGYNQGYFIATIIEPGHGYWVKVSQNGQLILHSQGALVMKTDSVEYVRSSGSARVLFQIRNWTDSTFVFPSCEQIDY